MCISSARFVLLSLPIYIYHHLRYFRSESWNTKWLWISYFQRLFTEFYRYFSAWSGAKVFIGEQGKFFGEGKFLKVCKTMLREQGGVDCCTRWTTEGDFTILRLFPRFVKPVYIIWSRVKRRLINPLAFLRVTRCVIFIGLSLRRKKQEEENVTKCNIKV